MCKHVAASRMTRFTSKNVVKINDDDSTKPWSLRRLGRKTAKAEAATPNVAN